MHSSDKLNCKAVFDQTAKIFNHKYNDDADILRPYYESLERYDFDVVTEAFGECVKSCKSFPRPAHLIEKAQFIFAEKKRLKKFLIEQQEREALDCMKPTQQAESIIQEAKKRGQEQAKSSMQELCRHHNHVLYEHQSRGKIDPRSTIDLNFGIEPLKWGKSETG